MKEFYYTVKDPIGMHARPATQLVNTVKGLASVVTVEKHENRCQWNRNQSDGRCC